MPTEKLEPQGWLESNEAFKVREEAFKKLQNEATDAAIKNGTAGRVVNDREEQQRIAKFRAVEKARLAQAKADHAVLMARRQTAKDFQDQQTLQEVRKVPDSELGSRLSKGEKNPHPKPIAESMRQIPTYAGVLGLFKHRKPEQVKELIVSATPKPNVVSV